MQTLFQKMRANRGRWIKPSIQAAGPATGVPFMVVDGERYVEAEGSLPGNCTGCAFEKVLCIHPRDKASNAFGRTCIETRSVIYIKAE